jgi:4-alpha-glucanotransferase
LKKDFAVGRHAGLLLPLFSMPSTRSWGIGEIGDLARATVWLGSAGLDFLQLLPINEMAAGQNSPYSATSAMAIDPIYIAVDAVQDFRDLGSNGLSPADRTAIEACQSSARIDYAEVRSLKTRALRRAFDGFIETTWRTRLPRAERLRRFVHAQAWWIEDYALFRAIHDREGAGRPWLEWPTLLRDRHPDALADARADLSREVLFHQYQQWLADEQWRAARRLMDRVGVFGDFPFMVAADSADVWAHQHDFWLEASVGTPPDAFSETGQDWRLPPYRWDVVSRGRFRWLRDRARRSGALFDGYRVDHLVGFYRTFVRPPGGAAPFFTPKTEAAQIALGERILRLLRSAGPFVIAEDLGTIPDFVRASMTRLRLPGYKVLRWERDWDVPGQPFRDPRTYPAVSVATSGTHDTPSMAAWWDEAGASDREAFLEVIQPEKNLDDAERTFTAGLRDAMLDALYGAGSGHIIVPMQDVFGWRDQINVPATITDDNWTWRLPWLIDTLADVPEAKERAEALRAMARRHKRAD